MGYLANKESNVRLESVRRIMAAKKLDTVLVCYDAMQAKIAAGVSEIEVAAAGEYAARSRGASGFGFSAIVGSGPRSNAVVPTASDKKLQAGELAMIGIAPKVRGYAGVVGDCLAVSGQYTRRQKESEFNGARIETGYRITDQGAVALSPKMDERFMAG